MKKILLVGLLVLTLSVRVSVAAAPLPAPAGWSMISNPCDGAVTPVTVFLPAAPEGTYLYKYDEVLMIWDVEVYSSGAWSPGVMALAPGEGTWILLPSATVLTFFGIPLVPVHSIGLPAGFSMRSAPSGLGLVGFPEAEGDTIFKYVPANATYDVYVYTEGIWDPVAPALAPGEACWVFKTVPGVWVQ
jgi:hypothetical protein